MGSAIAEADVEEGSPMFHYWETIFSLKLNGHVFVRAH